MTFSPRRFPDTITRLRTAPADRSAAGEYVEGTVTSTEHRASVQPIALTDADIVGGVSLVERLKVYVPEEDVLRAAFDDRLADVVVWLGTEYTVIESRSWPCSHTRATVLRET